MEDEWPEWVPTPVQNYLLHTDGGTPIRELARTQGCHASTILRQVRRIETMRDDPLVDGALRKLEHADPGNDADGRAMSSGDDKQIDPPDSDTLTAEASRVLRRLCEKGAVLAVALNMEKAVIVRSMPQGETTRTGVVDRHIAEALALKAWIHAETSGKITRYRITTAGRAALTDIMAKTESAHANVPPGLSEAPAQFMGAAKKPSPRRVRYTMAESPLAALARRRDKDGRLFLTEAQVHAGERLREDFELSQMGPKMGQNWDRMLLAGVDCTPVDTSGPAAALDARRRVSAAIEDLGEGLADVVMRCCCYLEGLETTEKRLGWSARSGKIVLRIGLIRLQKHYEDCQDQSGQMIG
ncbi:DUF6456 domain-containing protein [Sulfitobacter sp. S190]|uniref:DUF6456 domain-containing protein n=1 Tax=Sulfitobacter sp. S190 TaxID=2867022 RepID=UPI0021A2C8BF|nr:DUF6456 domain-containing protein [Sulfitobacter sp. S190]